MQPAAPVVTVHPAAPVAVPVQPGAPVSTIHPAATSVVAAPVQAASAQRTINVKTGDSLWKLAQQNLGRGSRYAELLAVNPGIVDPNQIRAGARLVLPAVSASPAARSTEANATASIKVRKGDTLWTLAKSSLGRSSAWPCLAAANPSLRDPNRIYEGQSLVLPGACTLRIANSPSRPSR